MSIYLAVNSIKWSEMMNKELKVNSDLKRNIRSWDYPLKGEIYSYTVVKFPIEGYEHPPYYIGLITLKDKNVKITARIILEEGQTVSIGQKVEINLNIVSEVKNQPILLARLS